MGAMKRCSTYCVVCMIFLSAFVSCSEDTVEPDTILPTVEINYPANSSIITGQAVISAEARDNRDISVVQFFVDDDMIAEDHSEPYEQTWYAGFWADGREYTLTAAAIDREGNKGISAPATVTLDEDSRYMPELIGPEIGEEIDWSGDFLFIWRAVPGARGYIFRIRSSDFNFNQYFCTSGGYGECFVNVPDTIFAGPLLPDKVYPIDWTADAYWRVRAYWSTEYLSDWSEERLVRF